MDAYLLDWANLLLRWAHVITAVAWIGASFHFVGLDNSLTPPLDEADRAKGIGGELRRCMAAASTPSRSTRSRRHVCPRSCTGRCGKAIPPG